MKKIKFLILFAFLSGTFSYAAETTKGTVSFTFQQSLYGKKHGISFVGANTSYVEGKSYIVLKIRDCLDFKVRKKPFLTDHCVQKVVFRLRKPGNLLEHIFSGDDPFYDERAYLDFAVKYLSEIDLYGSHLVPVQDAKTCWIGQKNQKGKFPWNCNDRKNLGDVQSVTYGNFDDQLLLVSPNGKKEPLDELLVHAWEDYHKITKNQDQYKLKSMKAILNLVRDHFQNQSSAKTESLSDTKDQIEKNQGI